MNVSTCTNVFVLTEPLMLCLQQCDQPTGPLEVRKVCNVCACRWDATFFFLRIAVLTYQGSDVSTLIGIPTCWAQALNAHVARLSIAPRFH